MEIKLAKTAGFCYGVRRAVDMDGSLGVLTGGLTAAAGGVAAATFFAAVMAAVFKPSAKR